MPIPETGFNTLDKELWEPLLTAEGNRDPQVALGKMKLLAGDKNGVERATVAGILLCTRSPERWVRCAYITATYYRGKDRASGQIDAQTITGPINRQITDAFSFVKKNMRVAARKSPAREEFPQYSERAFFEAIVNAVVHRDYTISGSRIRVSMFEDRLEIASPGSLPNSLTVDSMDARQSTRNEVLASMLGKMPIGEIGDLWGRQFFIERRGDGVPIIKREALELSGVPAEFKLSDGAELLVIIPSAPSEMNSALVQVDVRCDGRPVPNINLLALFPNKTWNKAVTNEHGVAMMELYSTSLPMMVFAAAPGYAAHIEQDWIPKKPTLRIEMKRMNSGGSVIFSEDSGHIPGFTGRLNPILDTEGRTYLYASNIAIDEGRPQPTHFAFGKPIRLTDSNGKRMIIRIMAIVGRSCLVEYSKDA